MRPLKIPDTRLGKVIRCALLAVCGALFALPLIFGKAWIVAWIAIVPVIITETGRSITKHYLLSSYFHGVCFFMAFGLITFSWFWQLYPLDYMDFTPGEALSVVFAAQIGLSVIQASVSSFIFVLLGIARKRNFLRRHPVVFSIYMSCAWVISEWLQSLTWAGVPWGRPALTQASFLPALQSASLLGSYAVTFLIIFVNCLIAASLLSKGQRKGTAVLAGLAAVVFSLNIIFGFARISVIEHRDTKTVTVAAVQGNVRFKEKWHGKNEDILERYRNLSLRAADDGAKIILWPETAVNYEINKNPHVAKIVEDIADTCDSELLCGAFWSEGNELYNIVLHADPVKTDSTIYKKQHLVPFGEYVPGEDIIRLVCPPLADLSPIDFPITAGNDSAVFSTEYGKICSLICFDSIYGNLALKGVRDGGELICISTNDSWFDGSAAQYQHNMHAVLRAIECGKYVVRAANTGISSIITPTGKITSSLGCNETGYITGEVSLIEDSAPYVCLSYIPVPLCIAAAALITVFIFKEKNCNDGNYNK